MALAELKRTKEEQRGEAVEIEEIIQMVGVSRSTGYSLMKAIELGDEASSLLRTGVSPRTISELAPIIEKAGDEDKKQLRELLEGVTLSQAQSIRNLVEQVDVDYIDAARIVMQEGKQGDAPAPAQKGVLPENKEPLKQVPAKTPAPAIQRAPAYLDALRAVTGVPLAAAERLRDQALSTGATEEALKVACIYVAHKGKEEDALDLATRVLEIGKYQSRVRQHRAAVERYLALLNKTAEKDVQKFLKVFFGV
jgi:transposase